MTMTLYMINILCIQWQKNMSPFENGAKFKWKWNRLIFFCNWFYSFTQGAYYSYWLRTISLACGTNDLTNNTYEMQQVIIATYVYYISKIIDLLDTVITYIITQCFVNVMPRNCITKFDLHLQVFFVLRKKNNQITFLHVYHHAGMVIATFVYFKFLSGN